MSYEVREKGYENLLEYATERLKVTTPIRVSKMNETEIFPKITERDIDGLLVKRTMVDKETREPLPPYSWEYKNEQNRRVEKFEIRYFKENDDGEGETEIQPFDATMGKDRRLKVVKEIPKNEIKNYVISEGYCITPRDLDSNINLFQIANDLLSHDKAVVVQVVHRQGFKRYWGIVVADINDSDSAYSLTLLTTTKKIQPIEIPIPTPAEDVKEQPQFVEGSLF